MPKRKRLRRERTHDWQEIQQYTLWYEVLKRWATEGHAGLDDKPSSAPHHPARKATLSAINEVRKLAEESPELGAYRVHVALEQIGIHLSQATCGRLLALNRKLYGLPDPKGDAPRERKEMPYRAHFKLEVLFAALPAFGAPSGIVSDGGGIFYSNQAIDVYSALGIRKERIEKRQAWQNYVESHFNIVRKMADAKFARAHSWEELIAIHRTWMRDYNTQRHWAHEKRKDGCHSPAEVIGSHKGTMYPESVLSRILLATRYTRYLDKNGFLRFQNWKFYGERGLAKAPVTRTYLRLVGEPSEGQGTEE
ncbi:MAG: helix-turn-helix domain-containing protein [Ktedonobacteraceae bacterium]